MACDWFNVPSFTNSTKSRRRKPEDKTASAVLLFLLLLSSPVYPMIIAYINLRHVMIHFNCLFKSVYTFMVVCEVLAC